MQEKSSLRQQKNELFYGVRDEVRVVEGGRFQSVFPAAFFLQSWAVVAVPLFLAEVFLSTIGLDTTFAVPVTAGPMMFLAALGQRKPEISGYTLSPG
jgi:hypothetical protein